MKNALIIFTLVFGLAVSPVMAQAVSDTGGPAPDVVRTYHENGNLKAKEHVLDGKRVGVYKEYWPNQKMKIKSVYNMDGVLDGFVRYHNESGVVTKKEMYQNGTLIETVDYVNGQPQ